jgi:tripartite-type tricarboxylate transporter receptor subunit TctC
MEERMKEMTSALRLVLKQRATITALTAGLALAVAAAPVAAQNFFEGKRLTFIVGGTAGAGLDSYVRIMARHMGEHVPGRPDTIVQNMPGAGSMKAAEFMESQSPKDGTTIGSIFPGAVMAPLLDSVKPRFDPRRFHYLGTAETGARICATFHTSKVKTFEDAQKVPAVIGASQSGGSSRDYTLMSNALAGTKFRMVSGYQGGADMFLAMERGEVEGLCGFDWSTIKTARSQWLRDKQINIIAQFGINDDPELTKMGVPNFSKYVSAADRPVADMIVAQQVFSRMFLVPAEVPADRVKILRDAFMKTMASPGFLADAERAQLNIDPLDGAKVQQVVEQIFSSKPDIIERARKAIAP